MSTVSKPTHPRFIDLTGHEYGMLTVVSFEGNRMWRCKCECGTTTTVDARNLRQGRQVSCGCAASDLVSASNETHGKTESSLYARWRAIKSRCKNPNARAYENYGGRGIRICKEWDESFEAFAEYVGDPPGPKHTIGRIDNDGHYEPGNVQWETYSQQNRNKRSTRFLTHKGKTKSVSDWAEITGISYDVIWGRIGLGWNDDRILSTPVNSHRKSHA